MSLPRPERGDLPGHYRRDHADRVRHSRIRSLATASCLAVAAGMLLSTTPGLVVSAADATPGVPSSSALTSSVVEIETGVVSRLRSVAGSTDILTLVDGIRGAADRATARRVLLELRGTDAALIRNACLMPPGSRGRTPIDGALGDPKATACISSPMREALAAAGPGAVVRDLTSDIDRPRLLLATALRDRDGVVAGALSIDLDLQTLLRLADASRSPSGGPLLVEIGSGALLATTGASVAPAAVGAVLPEGLTDDPAGAAAVTSLWSLGDGREIGLLAPTIAPIVAPVPVGSTLEPALVFAGGLVLILFLSAVAISLRRTNRRQAARGRVEALYRDATGPGVDGLTGLPDSLSLRKAMAERMATYLDEGVAFAVAIVDIDDLRAVNDRDGQQAGDEVIVAAAETLEQLTRPEDRVFRAGSDEFVLLMPGLDGAEAVTILERALHAYRRPPSGLRPGSFSCGISAVPSDSTDAEIVQRQAAAALSWVKAHGRGSVEAYQPDRDHVPDQPHDIATHAVREVVSGKLLSPVFQPIVDLQSGRVLGFEGLIRPDPLGPLPDTAHLFAAASASGRTVELDLACVEVVLAGAKAIGIDQVLTLNLSPRTLEVKDFDAAWLLDGLLRNGISPGRVIVELTERDAVGDLARLQRTISHLQSFGLRFAADDVGAGNSGLQLLSRVRFDIVKIDLTLVQQGVHDLGSRAVLESLRDLALSQEAHIVAEGVETAEQLNVLRDLEIGAAQGYLLGRPERSVEATFVDVRRLASGLLLVDAPVAVIPPATVIEHEVETVGRPRAGLAWGLGAPSAVTRR